LYFVGSTEHGEKEKGRWNIGMREYWNEGERMEYWNNGMRE
jgi:hypothetical protein